MKALALLRPHHWVKNLLVFAPLFFGGGLHDPVKIRGVCVVFAAFCLAAGGGYAWNDIADREEDAINEKKKRRPIPSGSISSMRAGITGFAATAGGLSLAAVYAPASLAGIGTYAAASALYSFHIKRIPILELLFFPFFYLARVFAGGAVAGAMPSHWLMLCIVFASLFMIVLKRQVEKEEVRYPRAFLGNMAAVFGTSTLISYGLYGILAAGSPYSIYSIFFPIAGIMRYMFLAETGDGTAHPERTVFRDPVLAVTVACWITYMYFLLY